MNEKRKMIIDAALKLFAAKGYHSTSIQEIVEKCEIAKGSFYNYFKSKEELLISIFKYFHETAKSSLLKVENDSSLTEREKYITQINLHIEKMTQNTDFIQMFVREQMVHISEELDQFIHFVRKESIEWSGGKVRRLYPDLPKEYILDCALIVDSLLKQYLSILFFDKDSDIKERIAPFLLNRLDSIVEGFLKHQDPLLKTMEFGGCTREPDVKTVLQVEVSNMIEMLEGKTTGDHKKVLDVLLEIHREVGEETPNKIVLESLLLMLQSKGSKAIASGPVSRLLKEYISN